MKFYPFMIAEPSWVDLFSVIKIHRGGPVLVYQKHPLTAKNQLLGIFHLLE